MAENTFLRLHNITSLGPILEGTKGKRGLRAIVYNSDGGGRRHLSGIKACCSVKAVAKDRLPPTYYPVLLHAPKPSLEMSASVRVAASFFSTKERRNQLASLQPYVHTKYNYAQMVSHPNRSDIITKGGGKS